MFRETLAWIEMFVQPLDARRNDVMVMFIIIISSSSITCSSLLLVTDPSTHSYGVDSRQLSMHAQQHARRMEGREQSITDTDAEYIRRFRTRTCESDPDILHADCLASIPALTLLPVSILTRRRRRRNVRAQACSLFAHLFNTPII